MHRVLARRVAALVLTTLIALSVAHVIFNVGSNKMSWGTATVDTPAHIADIAQGKMGRTSGAGCNPGLKRRPENIALCIGWGRQTVWAMMRERVPVDVQLILGGMLLGTFLGVAAGRWSAAFPDTWITRALRVVIAVLLSCPPYLIAFVFLVLFSWNAGNYRIPFVSGQGDYRPFGEDPLAFVKAMWVPWVCCALPLAALVSRITEASVGETLGEDYIRTARSKGLSERTVLNRHVLRSSMMPIAAMTGVNVSTMLIQAAAVEYGFGLPGMFVTIRGAIFGRDVPVMEALVLEGVILVVLANLLVDIFQDRLDPRIKTGADA